MSTYLPATDVSIPSFDVLGCKVHAVTACELTDLVERAVELRESCIVANHNLHSLYLYHHDAKLRELFAKAKWIHADGMGIVLVGRATGLPLQRSIRVTYVDWLPLLLDRAAQRKWRVFYLGSKPGVADKGIEILREQYPGLMVTSAHGYFDPAAEDNEKVLDEIRAFSPDVILVGMGMPRQEHWILDNFDQLDSLVWLPCGATIDYVAGEIPTPPRWAGRFCLEWLYRLVAEPRRLWKRYLVEPWFLFLLMGSRWLGSRSKMQGRI